MIMTVTVEGADRLAATMRQAADGLGMDAVQLDVARLIAAACKPPRRTGRLAASIQPSTDANRAVVSVGAPYANCVEYGTKYMRPRLFLTNAIEQTQSKWLGVYEVEAQRLLDDVRGA